MKDLKEIQDNKSLTLRERWLANQAWKNRFLDTHLSQNLYKNLISHFLLLAMFIASAVFLLWTILLKGVRFIPFYVLLACAAFLIPFFFLDVVRMLKLILRKRNERKKE